MFVLNMPLQFRLLSGISRIVNLRNRSTNIKTMDITSINPVSYITEEDIKLILAACKDTQGDYSIKDFSVKSASDKMLGFLAEYWKVKVRLSGQNILYFFVKAISRSNAAKANMVKELRLFEKEVQFYTIIKKKMEMLTPGLRSWAPKVITALDDSIVFEDLNALQYRLRNKFQRFDIPHVKLALQALVSLHASSIVLEENMKTSTMNLYTEYPDILFKAGYDMTSEWIIQCMTGALEALEVFSKYGEEDMNLIKSRWRDVWSSALDQCDASANYTNVICHSDLWNNNIMFHYNEKLIPDHCVLIDFQAIMYQPPAADVMVLLHCNLDQDIRENNLEMFLTFYYDELQRTLGNYNIDIDRILPKDDFLQSIEEYRLWGIISCACLLPQFWIDDDLTTKIFCDNEQFDDILSKNKGSFIKKMMRENDDYRHKVIELFEEIADRYVLKKKQDST